MSPKDFTRARSPHAIEARRTALLSAARLLLEDREPSTVSLTEICARANLVKSAVYRYFESREHLLIEIMIEDFTAFLETLTIRLKELEKNDYPAIAALIAELVSERRIMASLSAHCAAILETNISEQKLLDIKLRLNQLFSAFVANFAQAAPALGPRSAEAAQAMFAQISAWYSAAHPSPELTRVLQHPDLAQFRPDFRTKLETTCRAILIGMAAEKTQTT